MSQCTNRAGDSRVIERWPCANVRCNKLYQRPVPSSCECKCPDEVDQKCPENKEFNDNICECLCRDININCPGKSDFDMDTCNCVCPLQKDDCKTYEKLDSNSCKCIKVHSPPTPPSPSSCPKLECQSDTQYWDPNTCKCKCRRFLVKKTYYRYNRHGRSIYKPEFDGEDEDSRVRRSSSSGTSSGRTNHDRSGSNGFGGSNGRYSPRYALRCPAWKKVDYETCVCYW